MDDLNKTMFNALVDPSSPYSHDENMESEMISDLSNFRAAAKDLYMRSLLNPEYHVAKIPTKLPVSSATAAIRYNFSITPNNTGKFLLVIDPFYYKGYLYQDNLVDGQSHGTLTEIDLSQDNTIVDQYRLVSSSLIIKYYGNFSSMAGIFVCANTSNVTNANVTDFLNFSNIEDLTNKRILKCSDGLKMIYSPIDERATQFESGAKYNSGNHPCRWQYLFVVAGDLFPNTSSLRVDYFRNIEYTTVPRYREYITQTKDLPNDFSIPHISNNISPAPTSVGGSINDNNIPWLTKIIDFASRISSSSAFRIGSKLFRLFI